MPIGGTETNERARTNAGSRQQLMDQLYQAYLACAPASACIDATARTVTAGGLQLVPDDGDTSDETRPPAIQQLDALMRNVNHQEDLVQLCRSTITDLLTFGDGFVEVGEIATIPAALWTLDGTTMTVKADEHGNVVGYYQMVDGMRDTPFDMDDVMHISLDSPRGGVYGVSPMQKLMVPITSWLFTMATIKEYMRQGAPPRIAVDLGKDTKGPDVERWWQQYKSRNLGARNMGAPIITRVHPAGSAGEPPIKELGVSVVNDMLLTANNLRDQIISGFGMTPAMIGIIESGNLGGGTGESQARTFHFGTVLPLQSLLLEKLNYRLLIKQGVVGWKFQFGEVEYRDSVVVENIRDQRLRNGSWTLDDYLSDIGQKPVGPAGGGNLHVLVDRQNIVLWTDMEAMSKATVDKGNQSAITAGVVAPAAPEGPNAQSAGEKPDPPAPPAPVVVQPAAKPDDAEPAEKPAASGGAAKVPVPKESAPQRDARLLDEAWQQQYRAQRRRVLKELPLPGQLEDSNA